jgi:putative DeoR family transcriptional regulator (stage III sporulation protein D)
MNKYIERRVLEIATRAIKTRATVRQLAKEFGVSKSTAYKDLTARLLELDLKKANDAHQVLMENKQERHTRGGQATQRKYRMSV